MLSKSLQPTFSSEVRVSPSHSPPANVARDTVPFFQPTNRTKDVSSTPQRTGPDISAAQQQSGGKLPTDSSASGSSSLQRTGPDSTAIMKKSAGKLHSEHHRPKPSTGHTGPDTATVKSKLTGKPHTDSH